MKKSVADNRKLLGTPPSLQSPEWTEFRIGDHRLCLHAKGGKRTRPNGVLIVNAKGVKALHQALQRKKHRVDGIHEVHPGAWTFTPTDASGNEMGFYGAP